MLGAINYSHLCLAYCFILRPLYGCEVWQWACLCKFHEFSIHAVARSASDGSAIRYVLPILWMTTCFHIMELWGQN